MTNHSEIENRRCVRWYTRLLNRKIHVHWRRWIGDEHSPEEALRGLVMRFDAQSDALTALLWCLADDAPEALPAVVKASVDNTKHTRVLEVLDCLFASCEWKNLDWQSEGEMVAHVPPVDAVLG